MHPKPSLSVSKVIWSSIIRQELHRKTYSMLLAYSALISHWRHRRAHMPILSIWRGRWWCLMSLQDSPAICKSKTASKACSHRLSSQCNLDQIQPLPSTHLRLKTHKKVFCSPKKWKSWDCAFLTTTSLQFWRPFVLKYGVWCSTYSTKRFWWNWSVSHPSCH